MFIPITPVQLTGITADEAWHDIDCAAYIPVSATGVILRWYFVPYANIYAGFRKREARMRFTICIVINSTIRYGLE